MIDGGGRIKNLEMLFLLTHDAPLYYSHLVIHWHHFNHTDTCHYDETVIGHHHCSSHKVP